MVFGDFPLDSMKDSIRSFLQTPKYDVGDLVWSRKFDTQEPSSGIILKRTKYRTEQNKPMPTFPTPMIEKYTYEVPNPVSSGAQSYFVYHVLINDNKVYQLNERFLYPNPESIIYVWFATEESVGY